MWTTSRSAAHAEALESEAVGEQQHVFGLVGHCPPSPACRPTVSRPVVGHHTHAELPVEVLVRPAAQPGSRRPVQGHDREPLRITPDSEGKDATIRGRRRPERLTHDSSLRAVRSSPRPYAGGRAHSREPWTRNEDHFGDPDARARVTIALLPARQRFVVRRLSRYAGSLPIRLAVTTNSAASVGVSVLPD